MANEVDNIIKSFTDEQKAVYDRMMADEGKLFADWMGCRTMHADVMKVLNAKDIGPRVRLFLQGIASYWSGRKRLMETLLVTMGKKELLEKWIADVQEKSRTA